MSVVGDAGNPRKVAARLDMSDQFAAELPMYEAALIGWVGDAGTPEPASLRDQIAATAQEAMLAYWTMADVDHWTEEEEARVAADAMLRVDDLLAVKYELRWCRSDGGFFTTLPASVLAWIDDTSGGYLAWENAANARERAVGKDTDQREDLKP